MQRIRVFADLRFSLSKDGLLECNFDCKLAELTHTSVESRYTAGRRKTSLSRNSQKHGPVSPTQKYRCATSYIPLISTEYNALRLLHLFCAFVLIKLEPSGVI